MVQGQLHTEFMTVVPISLRRGVETECPRRLFRGKISLLRIKVPRVPRTISQEAPSTRHLQELVPNSEQPVLGAGNLLFKANPTQVRMKLLEARPLKTGGVILLYQPEGHK